MSPVRCAGIALALVVMSTPRIAAAQQGPQTALVLGSAFDTSSTVYALVANDRAREANPLLAHGGTVGFVIGKAATTAGLVWAIQKLYPNHRRIAQVIGYGGGAVLSGLAVRNVRVQQGHR